MSQPTLTHEQAFKPLTQEEFALQAPSAFTQKVMEGRSDKYVVIPTPQVVQDLEQFGWKVAKASQMRAKLKSNDGFQKHFVHLRNPELFVGERGAIEEIPEIVIVNSYNARCQFKMMVGMHRVVCSNGLIIQSSKLDRMEIPHRGYRVEDLEDLVPLMLKNTTKAVHLITKMKKMQLTPTEQRVFANQACRSRWDYQYKLTDTKEILNPIREEDEPTDLWTVYNRVQEKLTRGGWKGTGGRSVKALKNYDREISMNAKLFEVVESFMDKKSK